MERNRDDTQLMEALDIVIKGYMRQFDISGTPAEARNALANAVAMLHQTADDWAENLVGAAGPGTPEWDAANAKDLETFRKLLVRYAAPSVIQELYNTATYDVAAIAVEAYQESTGNHPAPFAAQVDAIA